jgi:uncharacterized SAM-binding protein YcdF (DUF218 family)
MEILFFLKKLLGLLLMPSAILFLILISSWFCYRSGFARCAKTLGLVSVISYYLLSTSPVANALLSSLESKYPAYKGQEVEYVLVLGGWHDSSPGKPISSILGSVSLNRLTEGILVYRSNPGAKLLLSGYKSVDSISHARAASNVAIALGVPEEDIYLAEDVKDTAEEARHWVEFVEGKALALVTSASHMPRSVYLFEKELKVRQESRDSLIPAPTNFLACHRNCFTWQSWIPRGYNLKRVDIAWHEYLGLIWARIQSN